MESSQLIQQAYDRWATLIQQAYDHWATTTGIQQPGTVGQVGITKPGYTTYGSQSSHAHTTSGWTPIVYLQIPLYAMHPILRRACLNAARKGSPHSVPVRECLCGVSRKTTRELMEHIENEHANHEKLCALFDMGNPDPYEIRTSAQHGDDLMVSG